MSPNDRNQDNGVAHDQDDNEEGAGDLLGGLIADAKDLVVAHGERVKLEVRDELGALKDTIKLVGVGIAAVVIAGLLATQAIVLGLIALTGIPDWAAYAIVAVVAGVVGLLVYKRKPAGHKIDLVPERSMEGVKNDAKMIKNAVTH